MKQQAFTSQLTALLSLFIALVLQKQYCLLRWFYGYNIVTCAVSAEMMLFVALVLQKNVVYCAGFTRPMLFFALLLRKHYCLFCWFHRNNVVYCAGFTETTLFIALVLRKQYCHLRWFCRNDVCCAGVTEKCCLLRWFYKTNVVFYAAFTESLLFVLLVSQKQPCLLRWFYKKNIHSLRNVLCNYSFILIAKLVTCWWSCQSDMCCVFQLRSYNQFCTT